MEAIKNIFLVTGFLIKATIEVIWALKWWLLLILIPEISKLIWDYIKFKSSKYQKISGHNYFNTVLNPFTNTGLYGEYLTFRILEKMNGANHVLTNVYLPNGQSGTTEIDVLLIDQTGIYVFESKNYSGWIYGDEYKKEWLQVFRYGYKKRFMNPIHQNYGHIEQLKKYLALDNEKLFKSIIIFSERCKLRNLKYNRYKITVLKRNYLSDKLSNMMYQSEKLLSEEQVEDIYNKLLVRTKVSEYVKRNHIDSIYNKIRL